ncbi:MAG: PKD domain-containing protein [bacterium]
MRYADTICRLSLISALLPAFLLAGCRGGCGSDQSRLTDIRPPDTELHDFLMSELARLGKDPAKTTSEAATGDANRVFDLNLALIDQDGPGGDPPTSVSINWSEVLIGDYDQNGLVNVSDLTPLGRELNGTVAYDDAAFHGGFAGWPAGDPIDDGGETPPSAGSPAANWRLARIDGDRNGLLTQADITPIAVHWQEALSGYRIYRQAPGESQFTIVPGKAGTSDGLSIDHPATPGNAPVLYGFEDDGAIASGVYLYYVAPYDLQSQQQGPASGIVSIDLDTGTVNSSPVASLTVTPDFAGAPAEITLDATASYDPDGSIAAWEWDFDGDGTTDWMSTDPLPETSSDGTVDSFVEVEPGVVKVTYRQGSDDYFEPVVRAVDDLAAASNPASQQLGISGWDYEVLNASLADYKLPIVVEAMSVDPKTNEIVVAGYTNGGSATAGVLEAGVYFARQALDGEWTYEKIPISDIGTVTSKGRVKGVVRNIDWTSGGQPMLHIARGLDIPLAEIVYKIWRSTQLPNGSWESHEITDMPLPEGNPSYLSTGIADWTELPDGTKVYLFSTRSNEVGSLGGSSRHSRYYLFSYSNGSWSVEYSGYDTAETQNEPRRLLAMPDGTLLVLFDKLNAAPELPPGIPAALWTPGAGVGEPFSLDGSQVDLGDVYRLELVHNDPKGTVYLYYEINQFSDPHVRGLVTVRDGVAKLQLLDYDSETDSTPVVNSIANGIGGTEVSISHIGIGNRYIEYRIDDDLNPYSEVVLPVEEGNINANYGSNAVVTDKNGRTYILATVLHYNSFPDTEFPKLYVLFRHLDPRLKGL